MRRRILFLFIVALTLTGFPALADDLSTPLGLRPINATFALDPGPTSYSADRSIDSASLYDPRYKLKAVSISDITISTRGPDLGAFSGTVKVNGVNLFTYDGQWNAFNTAQSLLTSSLLKKNQSGVNALVDALMHQRPVVLSISGSADKAPVAKNTNTITVYMPMQGSGLPL